MNKLSILALIIFLGTSCASRKEVIYFQDADLLDQQVLPPAFEPVIEKNDILYITISSLNEELTLPFKRNVGMDNMNLGNNLELQGYLVNSDGAINFPVLGNLNVQGQTRKQVKHQLEQQLRNYITDAVVDVRIINFKVSVMGEVKMPGLYTIRDERVTLPQALALAGDLTRDANRKNITVVREEHGKQLVGKIDLTETEVFSSPFFFLKQNDLIYVEPNTRGVKKSGLIENVPVLLSLVTVILSSVVLITR